MRNWIRKVLELEGPEYRQTQRMELDNQLFKIKRNVEELEKEVRESMKYIGALYEYLEVRPKRTFEQDYSRLPSEEFPTMEVVKAVKANKKK